MPPVPYPDLHGEQLDAAAQIRQARNGWLPNLYRMLLHSPAVATSWLGLGTAVRYRTALPPDLRELAICAVAARTGSEYVWHHHSALALENGVTDEQLLSVREPGHDAGFLEPACHAAVAYASAAAAGEVTQEDLEAVIDAFEPQQVVELAALAAYYTCTARFIDALQVDVDEAR